MKDQASATTRIGFFLRLLAVLIDAAFLFVALIILSLAWPIFEQAGVTIQIMNIGWIGGVIVYTFSEVLFAGTPGKLLLRQRIASSSGIPADRWQLFLRWTAKQLPLVSRLLYAMSGSPFFRVLGGFSA